LTEQGWLAAPVLEKFHEFSTFHFPLLAHLLFSFNLRFPLTKQPDELEILHSNWPSSINGFHALAFLCKKAKMTHQRNTDDFSILTGPSC
jgi:hypothetical protein